MNTIGERIKQVREKADLSQKAFGARIGLSQTAVTALENNQSEPRLSTFNKVVEAFRVNPEWLRTGDGNAAPSPTDPDKDKLPLSVVPESEQIKDLKEQLKDAREQLRFMRDLVRSGGDLSQLRVANGESFNQGDLNPAELLLAQMFVSKGETAAA